MIGFTLACKEYMHTHTYSHKHTHTHTHRLHAYSCVLRAHGGIMLAIIILQAPSSADVRACALCGRMSRAILARIVRFDEFR